MFGTPSSAQWPRRSTEWSVRAWTPTPFSLSPPASSRISRRGCVQEVSRRSCGTAMTTIRSARFSLTDSFGNRVDLLVGLRGLDPAAFTRAFDVPFQGERLRVVGREDFIAMKLFAHGPQDLADAEFALIAAGESLDVPLLERLAQRYGADT